MSSSDEKKIHDPEKLGFDNGDEIGASLFGPGRRMVRIAPPPSGSIPEEATDIGKQLELEANNAIKYRTCSWQKVGIFPLQNASRIVLHLPDQRYSREADPARCCRNSFPATMC